MRDRHEQIDHYRSVTVEWLVDHYKPQSEPYSEGRHLHTTAKGDLSMQKTIMTKPLYFKRCPHKASVSLNEVDN